MIHTKVKEKLQKNELTIGSWITIGHPNVAEILAQVGFDWLVIDLEHTSIDLTTTQVLISTIQSYGVAALVRVSKNEEVVIKRVMDMGANGVIVPMVNSATDAKKAVEFVKYPPMGKRGVGLYRAQKYGNGFEEYKNWLDEESIIIAQIEHFDAVNNIEEIIAVNGIDGVIIGPYDLSGSMGIPGEFDGPEVQVAIKKVEQTCEEKKFPSGYHVIEPNAILLKEKIEAGFTFLAFSTDFFFMSKKVKMEFDKIHK